MNKEQAFLHAMFVLAAAVSLLIVLPFSSTSCSGSGVYRRYKAIAPGSSGR